MTTTARTPGPTWAVVGIETTGLSPKEHRIAEVAVVVLDERGNPLGEASTLIDPQGDLGPYDAHGIAPRDVEGAPRFADLAGWLGRWLQGKVVVGHNMLFTTAFLDEEYRRAGIEMPHVPAICTMTHAPRYLPSLPGRTLEQCCAAAGVPIDGPPSALTDARAAGALFGVFLASRPVLPSPWVDFITRSRRLAWPRMKVGDFRMASRPALPASPATHPGGAGSGSARVRARADGGHRLETTSEFVVDVVDQAPRQLDEPDTVSAYLGALDSAVSDRVLSFTEAIHLNDLAGALAIFEAEQAQAHRAYLRTLAATAWADHQITDEERADLLSVGKLLDISADEVLSILEAARPAAARDAGPVRDGGAARDAGPVRDDGVAQDGERARHVGRAADVGRVRDGERARGIAHAPDGGTGRDGGAVDASGTRETGYAPGWYADPSGGPGLRWYDGAAWTEHTHA